MFNLFFVDCLMLQQNHFAHYLISYINSKFKKIYFKNDNLIIFGSCKKKKTKRYSLEMEFYFENAYGTYLFCLN